MKSLPLSEYTSIRLICRFYGPQDSVTRDDRRRSGTCSTGFARAYCFPGKLLIDMAVERVVLPAYVQCEYYRNIDAASQTQG